MQIAWEISSYFQWAGARNLIILVWGQKKITGDKWLK